MLYGYKFLRSGLRSEDIWEGLLPERGRGWIPGAWQQMSGEGGRCFCDPLAALLHSPGEILARVEVTGEQGVAWKRMRIEEMMSWGKADSVDLALVVMEALGGGGSETLEGLELLRKWREGGRGEHEMWICKENLRRLVWVGLKGEGESEARRGGRDLRGRADMALQCALGAATSREGRAERTHAQWARRAVEMGREGALGELVEDRARDWMLAREERGPRWRSGLGRWD